MNAKHLVVAVGQIHVQQQCRKHFDVAGEEGLAQSIAAIGLQQPLLCRGSGDDIVLVDGERRLRACQRLGKTEIDIFLVEDQIDVTNVLARQLACNLQRSDLSVVERAEGIRALMDQGSLTADQAARHLGLSPSTVSKTLAVLALPAELLGHARSGVIPQDAAYMLARLEDVGRQQELANEVVAGTLTRDGLAQRIKGKPRAARPSAVMRVTAALGGGRSVTFAGAAITLDSVIDWTEQWLARARKAKGQGLTLETLLRTLRDQAAH